MKNHANGIKLKINMKIQQMADVTMESLKNKIVANSCTQENINKLLNCQLIFTCAYNVIFEQKYKYMHDIFHTVQPFYKPSSTEYIIP